MEKMAISIIVQLLLVLLLFVGIKQKEDDEDILCRNNTDAIRYISCYIVLLSHTAVADTNLKLYLGYLHFVCVFFFFVLSGYGLTTSYIMDRDRFIKRQKSRCLHLIIPFLFVLIINKIYGYSIDRGGILNVLVMLFFYLGMSISVLLTNKKHWIIAINGLVGIVYSLVIQGFISFDFPGKEHLGWAAQSIGFTLGIIISFWKDIIILFIVKNRIVVTLAAIITGIPVGIIYMRPHNMSIVTSTQFFERIIIQFLIFLLVMVFLTYFKMGNTITNYIGSHLSMYIFLFHGTIICFLESLCLKNEGVYLILVILGTTLCAIIGYRIELLVKEWVHNHNRGCVSNSKGR